MPVGPVNPGRSPRPWHHGAKRGTVAHGFDLTISVEVADTIVDMDLERGWLLVTLVDGRMGTLDLAYGTFNVLANGIRNAVWQE